MLPVLPKRTLVHAVAAVGAGAAADDLGMT